MKTQLTRGLKRRIMYIENKNGQILGSDARIGWVSFSKTGRSVYYAGKTFQARQGIGGNFFDIETEDEYWISGVKKRGSNTHYAERTTVVIDDDAQEEYERLRHETSLIQ